MIPVQHFMPPARAQAWTPVERPLPAAVTDGRNTTYELLRVGGGQDPCDFGLVWPAEVTVGAVRVSFATLGGRSFEPDPRAAHIELWRSGRWEAVPADLEIDTRRMGEIAPAQMRGTVRWTFRFQPRAATRVRVYASAPAHRDLAYQCIALTELDAAPDGVEHPTGTVRYVGPAPTPPRCLLPGANLAVAEAGATVGLGNPWTVHWIRPMTLTSVQAPKGVRITAVEWTNGRGSRPVRGLTPEEPSRVSFAPIRNLAKGLEPSQG